MNPHDTGAEGLREDEFSAGPTDTPIDAGLGAWAGELRFARQAPGQNIRGRNSRNSGGIQRSQLILECGSSERGWLRP